MKQPLTPSIVFSSIAVFDSLGYKYVQPLLLTDSEYCTTRIRLFLFYLNNTITGKVSLDRIDTFLHEVSVHYPPPTCFLLPLCMLTR